jgi:hypothetical protein
MLGSPPPAAYSATHSLQLSSMSASSGKPATSLATALMWSAYQSCLVAAPAVGVERNRRADCDGTDEQRNECESHVLLFQQIGREGKLPLYTRTHAGTEIPAAATRGLTHDNCRTDSYNLYVKTLRRSPGDA